MGSPGSTKSGSATAASASTRTPRFRRKTVAAELEMSLKQQALHLAALGLLLRLNLVEGKL